MFEKVSTGPAAAAKLNTGGSFLPEPPPGAGADVLPAPKMLESAEISSWTALTGLTLVTANPKPMAAKVLTIFFQGSSSNFSSGT